MAGKDFSIKAYLSAFIEKFTGKREKTENSSQASKNIPILPEQDPNDERIGADNFERGEIVTEYGIYIEPDPMPMPNPTEIHKYAVPGGFDPEPIPVPTVPEGEKGSNQWAEQFTEYGTQWYDITYDNQGRVIEMKWRGTNEEGVGIDTVGPNINISYADDGSFEVIKEGGLNLGRVNDTLVAKVEIGYDAKGNEIYTQKYDAKGNLLSTEKAPLKLDFDSELWANINNTYNNIINFFKNLFS